MPYTEITVERGGLTLLRRLLAFFLPCTILIAQTAQYPQQYPAQQSYAHNQNSPRYPPERYNWPVQLSECEGNECGVWTMNGSTGVARWPSGAIGQLTFERFGFDGVKIQRKDVSGHTPGIIATYTGTIDGNHIAGRVTWSWPGVWARSPSATWFAFITQPASFTLLDSSYPCDQASDVSPAEAAIRGAQAVEAKRYDVAVCWLRSGASRGDANAKGMLSAVLYQGLTGAPDYAAAFNLARDAASGANYLGDLTLSLLYGNGNGIPKDALLAKSWKDKADVDRATFLADQHNLEEKQRTDNASLQRTSLPQPAAQGSDASSLLMLLLWGSAVFGGDGGSGTHTSGCQRGQWVGEGSNRHFVCTSYDPQ